MNKIIDQYFNEASFVMAGIGESLSEQIDAVIKIFISSLESGGTIFWCGNGGSASDCQHLAAELIGKFKLNREPLRSIALTTDTSVLTATGNDFGFEEVFKRQIQGLGRPGDVLVGLSTSGASENVILAIEKANSMQLKTIAFTGAKPSPLWDLADISLPVPSEETSHIQEGHIAIGQLACGLVEQHFFG